MFLREIAKRLIVGLEPVFPDLQERANHIYKYQLFGLAITELTGLLSRRSVYCSKMANGRYSVCSDFEDEQGNIVYARVEHDWRGGKCGFCGASQEVYERGDALESYAYQFIHADDPSCFFKNMKFDVIVGNPPYQLGDSGFGRSASPIYNLFVEQAKKLNPRYLAMIIPSRWFAGGKGLDKFRDEMLNDNQFRKLVDYPDAAECFPGVDIAGGICYFLWEKDYSGLCEVVNIYKGAETSSIRPLNEFKTFVRYGAAVPIINKVLAKKERSMNLQVSSRKPFGLGTNIRPSKKGELTLVWNGGKGLFERDKITVGQEIIDKWKVITSKVSYDHAGQPDKEGKRRVLSKVEILPPNTICTETYIVAGSFSEESNAINLANYLRTKFVRFLVSQLSFSQDITKDRFYFVPILNMDESWTDEKLYKKYGLTAEEIAFIESMIRPMELDNP